MRLVLIRPPAPHLVNPAMYGPIGLEYLKSYVERHAPYVDVTVCDMACGDDPPPADVYGWTATSLEYQGVVELASRYAAKGISQIIGGPHATVFGGAVDQVFDAVFMGEGEESLCRWLEARAAGRPAPVVNRAVPLPNLDDIPFPARRRVDDCPTIVASRGCPYQCAFCATQTMWDGFRQRSPANVVAEMESLGARTFNLSDDTPSLFREWGTEFCWRVAHLNVRWRAQARANEVNPERLEMLRRAGCEELCVGVESFDQTVLDILRKRTNVRQVKDAIRMISESGIRTRLFMMIGTPGEAERTVRLNEAALADIAPYVDVIRLQTFMPLPGTPVWNDPAAFGVTIADEDFSKHNRYGVVKAAGGVHEAEPWSPIRIEGLTYDQQLANIRDMRRVVGLFDERVTLPPAAGGGRSVAPRPAVGVRLHELPGSGTVRVVPK